jgi:plasmid replication initiation protein
MTVILHTSKTLKVYKSKKLNKSGLTDYTLNDYQVFLLLITKLGKVDELGKYLQPEVLERNHTVTAKEFSKAFNVDLSYSYRVLQGAAKKLAEKALTIEDDITIQHIPVCAIAKYHKKSGNLTIEFNQHIMAHLAQVQRNFVVYNLKEIANFGSLYTTRLYELIQQFADTGEFKQSIEQLRKVFDVGARYKTYGDFKRFTFAHAVDEINSNYETELKFIELNALDNPAKIRQKVTAIRFEFKRTFTRRAVNPQTGKERNIYIKPKRKNKDDNNPPPPRVHADQQELPNIDLRQEDNLFKQAVSKIGTSAIKLQSKFGDEKVKEVAKQKLEEGKINPFDKAHFKATKETIVDSVKSAANKIKCTKDEFYELIKIEILINNTSQLEAFRKINSTYSFE